MTQLGTDATTGHKLLLALACSPLCSPAGMLAEHLLQLALKMHVPIRRLLAESLLAKVMKQGGKSFDDRPAAGFRTSSTGTCGISRILADPAMPVTMALQLIGTIAPAGVAGGQCRSGGLRGAGLLLLIPPGWYGA